MLLVRHPPVVTGPECCYGRLDVPLAPGWERCLSRWTGEGPIFASPASRCRLPAARLGAEEGRAVSVDPRLAELDFGCWEGKRWEEVPREALDSWAGAPLTYRPGGGEAVRTLIERVTAFWEERLAHRQSCRVVTHGGPLRVLLALAEKRAFRMSDRAPAQGDGRLLYFFNNDRGMNIETLALR